MKTYVLYLLSVILILNGNSVARGAPISASDATKWQADLDYMSQALEKYHRNAFHDVTRENFLREVATFRERIPTMTREDIVIGLKRLIAMIKDAHTGFGLSTVPPIGFHSLPIKIYIYSDGVFVQAAAPPYTQFVGAKLVRIGHVPVDEAFQRIAVLADASSEWTFRSQAQFFLKGEVLQALGLSDKADSALLTFATPKGLQTVQMQVLKNPISIGYAPGAPKGSDWIDAAPAADRPRYLQHKFDNFFFEYLTDEHLLYVQCNAIQDSKDESFYHFFERVFAVADANRIDKFILDLRLNGGGDNTLTPIVVQNIIRREKLNQRGKFFVITGRDTQSAAQNLVNRLQRDTKAIFVGEPTGEKPNHYGDPQPFILPNSHIEVHISSTYWQDLDPADERRWTGPDLAAELKSTDYTQNIDPAVRTITQAPFISLSEALEPAISQQDIKGLQMEYASYLGQPEHRFAQTQNAIDKLANDLIARGKKEIAIELLKLNAATYSHSVQAIDSLGDGYLALGDRAHAVECYKSAVSIKSNDALAASRLSSFAAGITPNP